MPLHVSGVMADYSVSKRLTVSGGWTAGEQNSFTNRFDDSAFLGKVTFVPGDKLTVAYNLYFGRSYGIDKVADAKDRFRRNYHTASHIVQSLILTANLVPKWMYMIETSWADNRYNNNDPLSDVPNASYVGINQHLIYTINKQWATGLRFEWNRGKNSLFDVSGGEGYQLYALTLGANWTPNKWLILRPELRHDWYNGGTPFANGTKANQLSGGGSCIVKF